ncbi:MAG: hypothetical protein LLF94_11290 [Chlamydiales bacterium]|nr:hypothetical protein [Chlamydiales bacterium]
MSSVARSLKALEDYAQSLHVPNSPRMLLRLITVDGQTVLDCKPAKKGLQYYRKNYQLKNIAAFLSSPEFCSAVYTQTIGEKDIKLLHEAALILTSKISHHNEKVFSEHIPDNLHEITRIFTIKYNSSSPAKHGIITKRLSLVESRIASKFQPKLSEKEVLDKQKQTSQIEGLTGNANADQWQEALDALSSNYEIAANYIPPKHLDSKTLWQQKLQLRLHEMVSTGVEQMIDDYLQNFESLPRDEWKKRVDNFDYRVERYIAMCQENLQPDYDFYTKWEEFLKEEMIQGFVNPSEILGSGACWALSLRWSIQELTHKEPSNITKIAKELKIGTVSQRDRFNQAFLQATKEGVTSKQLESIKKRESVATSENFIWAEDLKNQNLKEILTKNLSSKELAAYDGVGQLCFWWSDTAHAITITCRIDPINPQNSVLHIIDPFIGLLNFPVPVDDTNASNTLTTYIECLTDLLTTFYGPDFNKITCTCFTKK